MVPDAVLQLEQVFRRGQLEAGVARRLGLVVTEGDVDLLAVGCDIEPVSLLVGNGGERREERG